MPKLQRQFKTGSEYSVEGVSERVRRLRFAGRLKLPGVEMLVFRPVRKARKTKRRRRRR